MENIYYHKLYFTLFYNYKRPPFIPYYYFQDAELMKHQYVSAHEVRLTVLLAEYQLIVVVFQQLNNS